MEISDKNAAMIEKFRTQVQDLLQPEHDDYFLLRWLIAREMNLTKAEKMIRESFEWRKKYNVDNILTDYNPPEVLVKYFPGGHLGTTKDGYVTYLLPSGRMDMTGLSLSARRQDVIMYNIYITEQTWQKMRAQTEKLGEKRLQAYLISDMEGFTLTMLFSTGMDILLKALQIIEDNYPETLKHCYVVNAPSIFPLVFNMCKPFLSEETKKKVIILGKDWRQKLNTLISEEDLPVHWGGTVTDPGDDVYCKSKICMGGKVPSSYYLKSVDMSKFTKACVCPGKTVKVPFEVTKPKTVIKYRFQTQNHDLGFCVLFYAAGIKPSHGNATRTIVEHKRYQCHLIPEDGVIDCDQLGTYVLQFDNTFSWLKSKSLSYYVDVVETDKYIEENAKDVITAELEAHGE